jgi:hypothetical protein
MALNIINLLPTELHHARRFIFDSSIMFPALNPAPNPGRANLATLVGGLFESPKGNGKCVQAAHGFAAGTLLKSITSNHIGISYGTVASEGVFTFMRRKALAKS